MAIRNKMGCDKAFFGERVPWTAKRNKMDGDDKENGWRQVRRWDATRHFLGKECHGWRPERRNMAATKKKNNDQKENGWRHGIFWGKSAIGGDKKKD